MIALETDRLIIRNYREDDAPAAQKNSSGAGVREHLPEDALHSVDEAVGHICECIEHDRDHQYPVAYGIALKDTGELIGEIGLCAINRGVEISYFIADAHQNHGYASEAITAFCSRAIRNPAVERIFGMTKAANIPSCKAMEKAGFALIEEKQIIYYGEPHLFKIYVFA